MVALLIVVMLGLSGCKADEVDARTYVKNNKNPNSNENVNNNVDIDSDIDFNADVDIKADFDADIDIDIGADIKADLDILTSNIWGDKNKKEQKSTSTKGKRSNERKTSTAKKQSDEKKRVSERRKKEDKRNDGLSGSAYNTNTNTGSGSAYNTNTNTGSGSAYNTNTNTGSGSAYNTNTNTGSGSAYNTNTNTGSGSAYNTNTNTGSGSAYNTNTNTGSGSAYNTNANTGSGSAYNTNANTGSGSAYNTNTNTGSGSAYNTNTNTGSGSGHDTGSGTGADTNANGNAGSGSNEYILSPEVGKLFRLEISNFKDKVELWVEDKSGNRVDALLRLEGDLAMTIKKDVAEFTKLFLVERSMQHVLVVQKEPGARRISLRGKEPTVTWTLERHGSMVVMLDVTAGLTVDGNVGVKLHIVTIKGDKVKMSSNYGANMRVTGATGTATFVLQPKDETMSFDMGCYRWVAEAMDRALFSAKFGSKCNM